MSDLWIPDSAREPEIGGVAVQAHEPDRKLSPDDVVHLPAQSFDTLYPPPGEDGWNRASIPSVVVDYPRLRQQVIDRTAVVELYAITLGFGQMRFDDGARAYLQMGDCHICIGPIDDRAPVDWLGKACSVGFAVAFTEVDGSLLDPWIATGPIDGPSRPLETIEGKRRPIVHKGRKVGRNEPCPCRSGIKFKRCCGR